MMNRTIPVGPRPRQALFVLALGLLCAIAVAGNLPQRWVATWSTSNVASDHPVTFSNQTIRNLVHTTVGGCAVRIRLSNTFGPRAIRFDAVFVGLQKEGAALVAGSNHQVTFGGSRSIGIPEGAEALSDPTALSVGSGQNLAISLFTSGETGPATVHGSAFQTNYGECGGSGAVPVIETSSVLVAEGESGHWTAGEAPALLGGKGARPTHTRSRI
jgi:hypothetical protein